jgi:hypothetical protein
MTKTTTWLLVLVIVCSVGSSLAAVGIALSARSEAIALREEITDFNELADELLFRFGSEPTD